MSIQIAVLSYILAKKNSVKNSEDVWLLNGVLMAKWNP